MIFYDERYESLVLAIGLIDAAMEALDEFEDAEEVSDQLTSVRNDLNAERIKLLGNGTKRPWHVSDLELSAD